MAQAKHDSITRRALLSGAAAIPVVAVSVAGAPALPSPDFASAPSGLPALPDPIFAAIEAHVRALADLSVFLDELADIEQAAWHAQRGTRRAANKRLKEAYADERRLGGIESDAMERFVATVPRTLQGAAAALAYVRAHYAEGYPMCEEEECMMLLASTEQAICRTAGLPVPCVAAKDAEAA